MRKDRIKHQLVNLVGEVLRRTGEAGGYLCLQLLPEETELILRPEET